MPLNLDNVLQSNSGSFDASSGAATLDTATTADNHVVIYACLEGDNVTNTQLNVPSGFTQATDAPGSANFTSPYVFWKLSAGGETSFTLDFAAGGPSQVLWRVEEVVGLDLTNPVHVVSGITPFDDSATATTRSTGTTAATSSYDVLAKAVFTARGTTSAIPVWSGYTNGFTEEEQVGATDGSRGVAMAIVAKPRQALATHECTASLDAAANARGTLVVFTAQDAKWAPTIDAMTGFEFGTATNLTTTSSAAGMTGSAIYDEVAGSPEVVSTFARTGTYALRLSATAAAEYVAWTNPGVLSLYGKTTDWYDYIDVMHFYFDGSLPSGDLELSSVEAGSAANGMVLAYRSASQKLGLTVGSGTEVLSDATVSADTWIGVHRRYFSGATTHTCDWAVDYDSLDATTAVEQAQASGTSMTQAAISGVYKGWKGTRTGTVYVDDCAVSKVVNNYPIGRLNMHLLKVAGTPTIEGTSTEFEVFTANGGTRAAVSAAGILAALDDVPPTIGASADGITQITNNTVNYAHLPMDTIQAAPNNVPRALRWYVCPWAASATAATLGLRFYDGETETFIGGGAVDHGQDSSTLMWICRMLRTQTGSGAPYYLLTQARLDALEFRFGFSGDASPDVGIHTVFAEVALAPADVFEVANIENKFFLHVRQDPVSQGVASYLVTVAAGTRGATFTYSINGVAQDPHYVSPNALEEVTYEQVIGADSIETATSVGLAPDPTE